MFTIRKATFETNSSSTHSMVICTQEEYDKWSKGELYASRWENGFKTKASEKFSPNSCTNALVVPHPGHKIPKILSKRQTRSSDCPKYAKNPKTEKSNTYKTIRT